ncbi:MAG: hypothetical protein EP329_05610, partial [Deltaproteobacteria bacterium]
MPEGTARLRAHALLVAAATALLAASSPAAAYDGPGGVLAGTVVENRGQLAAPARFVLRRDQQTVLFLPDRVVYATTAATADPARVTSDRLVVLPLGHRAARVEGVAPRAGRVHYLRGPRERWITDAPTFGGVAYRDLWPGIDVVYRSTAEALKTDVLVAPGADPARVAWHYVGALSVDVDAAGRLVVETPSRTLTEAAPVAWQDRDGARVAVDVAWRVGAAGEVGYLLGPYDSDIPLVIDPPLAFSTFYGGDGSDRFTGVAVAADGGVVAAGYTTTSNLATAGAFDDVYAGEDARAAISDGLVVALGPDGALRWATYLGGTRTHFPDLYPGQTEPSYYAPTQIADVALTADGRVVVTGPTKAIDFPLASPLSSALVGEGASDVAATDAFVSVLAADGKSLAFSTYLGGKRIENVRSVAVLGDLVAIGGYTSSTDFPAQLPPDDIGQLDDDNPRAFATVLRLPAGGAPAAFVYSNVLVAGAVTRSAHVGLYEDAARRPQLVVAYTVDRLDAGAFAFVGDGQGTTLSGALALPAILLERIDLSAPPASAVAAVRSVSGDRADVLHDLAVDRAGAVALGGCTTSDAGLVSASSPHDGVCGTGGAGCPGTFAAPYPWSDGFVVLVSPSFSASVGSYLGGEVYDCVRAVTFTADGVGAAGLTASRDFPVRAAFQPTSREPNTAPGVTGDDAELDDDDPLFGDPIFHEAGFVSLFSRDGELLLSTYVAGSPTLDVGSRDGDYLLALAADSARERLVAAGAAFSADYPTYRATRAVHGSPVHLEARPDPLASNGVTYVVAGELDAVVTAVRTDVADVLVKDARAEPRAAARGDTTTLRVTVANDGPKSMPFVTLGVVPDAALVGAVTWTVPEACDVQLEGAMIVCELGALARGETRELALSYPNPEGPGVDRYTHVVTAVVSGRDDPNLANNRKTIVATAGGYDLLVVPPGQTGGSAVAPAIGQIGHDLTYTVVARNDGPEDAVTAALRCVVGGETSLIDPLTAGCQVRTELTPPQLQCALGALAKGAAKTVTFKVRPVAPGKPYRVPCTVVGDVFDEANPDNDTAHLDAEVRYPDLGLLLLGPEPAPVAGAVRQKKVHNVTASLQIENRGVDRVDAVRLELTLPDPSMGFPPSLVPAGCAVTPASGPAPASLRCADLTGGQGLPTGGAQNLSVTFTTPDTDKKIRVALRVAPGDGSGAVPDHTPLDNVNYVDIWVGGADLKVGQVVESKDPALAGQLLTVRFDVTNLGPEDAPAAKIDVTRGGGAKLQALATTAGGACADTSAAPATSVRWTCDQVPIPAGQTVTATATYTVDDPLTPTPQQLVSHLRAEQPGMPDHEPGNDAVGVVTTLLEGVSLGVTVPTFQSTTGKLAEGESGIVHTGVENHGDTAAAHVVMAVTAVGKATFRNVVTDTGPCTPVDTTRFECRRDALAAHQGFPVTALVRAEPGAAAAQSFQVALAVRSDKPDPDPSDDARSLTVQVVPGADLGVTFALPQGVTVAQGATFELGFDVKNAGPEEATAVSVTGGPEAFADKLRLLAVSGSGCAVDAGGQGFTCAPGPLASGGLFTGRVTLESLPGLLDAGNPDDQKQIPFRVTVDGAPHEDPTQDDRSVQVPIRVQHGASVHLFLGSGLPTRLVAEKTYQATVSVRNDGPHAATRLGTAEGALLDITPLNAHSHLVSASFGGVPCAIVDETGFRCALGSYPAGAEKALALSFLAKASAADAGEDLSLRLTFTADEKDRVPANRVLALTRPVDRGADLRATVSDPADPAAEDSFFLVTAHLCNDGPDAYAADDGKAVHVALSTQLTGLTGVTGKVNGAWLSGAECAARTDLLGWDCAVFPVGSSTCADLAAFIDVPAHALPDDPDATGTVKTTFTVTTDRGDPTDGAANVFVETTTIKHGMDLSVAMSAVSPAPAAGQAQKVALGGRASYSVRVHNADTAASPPAKLRLAFRTLAGAAAMQPVTPLPGCEAVAGEPGFLDCALPPLPPGADWPAGEALALDMKVVTQESGNIDVGASVTATTRADRTPADNIRYVPVVLEPGADLSLTALAVDHNPAATETTAHFTARLCNAGPTAYAAGDGKLVRVDFLLADQGRNLVGTSSDAAACVFAGGRWTCDALAKDACVDLHLAVPIPADYVPAGDPDASAVLGLTLVAQGDVVDPTPADLNPHLDVLVTRPTDLSVQLTQVTPAPDGSGVLAALLGDAAEVAVDVYNHASTSVSGAVVALWFNAGAPVWTLSGGASGCRTTASALECDLPDLAAGASSSATFSFTAAKEGTGSFKATVGVPLKGDKSPDDNTRTLGYAVRDKTRLAVTATAPDHADVGQPFDLVVTVSQEDPTAPDAQNVAIGIAYPGAHFAAPQVAPSAALCGLVGASYRCLVDVPQGGAKVLTVKMIPRKPGSVVLDAQVEPTRDETPANNVAEAPVELGAAQLSVAATVPEPVVWDTEFDATVTLTNAGPAAALGAHYSCETQLAGVSPFVAGAGYVDDAHVRTSPARLAVGATAGSHRLWPRIVDVNSLICKGHQTYPHPDGDGLVQTLFSVRGADLGVVTSGPVETPVGPFTVGATVTNHGPAKTGATDVSFALPRGIDAALPLPAGCSGVGTPILCRFGPLAVGASASAALPLVTARPGGFSVGVHAGADVGDDGTHPQDATEVVTVTDVDSDGDGVPDSQEAGGSPSGDANGDGVADKDQAHVATLPDPQGQATTFVAPAGVVISQLQQAPVPPLPPSGVFFPTGFFSFRLGVAPGAATTLDLLLPAGVPAYTFWKYGPTPDQAAAHWYRFDYDGTTGAERVGPTLLRLHLVDGGRGDDDLSANGVIVDPGAPALREGRVFAVQDDADLGDEHPGDGLCANANGGCDLRAALDELNALGDPGAVVFDLPGDGPHVLAVASPLPTVSVPVVLDATTQPGWTDAPVVALAGAAVGPTDGLVLAGGASTVRGLNVYGFDGDGVRFEAAGANRVAACVVGTDMATASADLGGRGVVFDGVGDGVIETSRFYGSVPTASVALVGGGGSWVRANAFGLVRSLTSGDQLLLDDTSANTVGGRRVEDANVLTSTEVGAAVRLQGPAAADNRVVGNLLGLEPGGVCRWSYPEGHPCNLPDHGGLDCPLCLFTSAVGVAIAGGAHDNRVGGASRDEGNAFGALDVAVEIAADAPDNVVSGNTFGVFADGRCDPAGGCPPSGDLLVRGPRTTVGGDGEGEGNLVAGGAVEVVGAAATGSVVAGNRLGLLPDGTARAAAPP